MNDLFDLIGDVVVVMGVGRGIGEGIVMVLVDVGVVVVCVVCWGDEIERVVAGIWARGGWVLAVFIDVIDFVVVEVLVDVAMVEFGWFDIWINNVGGLSI